MPKRLGHWAGWALAAATLLLAALLAYHCIGLYTAPENQTQPYTWEAVAARLLDLRWAFGLWLAVWAAALFQNPIPGREPSPVRMRWHRMADRTIPSEAMEKERRLRKVLDRCFAAVLLLCTAYAGVYLLDNRNFASRDLEAVVGSMLGRVLVPVLVGFAAGILWEVLSQASMVRELALAKNSEACQPQPQCQRKDFSPALRMVLLAIAAVLILMGTANGGMRDVLVKAINICTECIGLG